VANGSHKVSRASNLRLGRHPSRTHAADRPAAWFLSPTDLSFLWQECPRCLYRKVVLGQPRPRAPFPALASRGDRDIS